MEDGKEAGPVLVSATGPYSSAVFAAVFEQGIQGPWQARHGVPAGMKNQGGSFDNLNASFAAQSLYLRSFAIYGDSNDRRYIAVSHANPGYVKWHVHAADPAPDYQATFDAETQLPGFGLHGYRPRGRAISEDGELAGRFLQPGELESPMYIRGERVAIPACPAACSSGLCVQMYLPHMLRQLGDVGGDAPGPTVRPALQLALSWAALCREMPQNQPISLHRVTSH
jgi:hypothetical protein